MTRVTVTALHFEPRGFVPNNLRLPVLIYEKAFDPAAIGDLATSWKSAFKTTDGRHSGEMGFTISSTITRRVT